MSTRYLQRAFFWLVTTTGVYLVMNGAQIFETVLIVPSWTAGPPASLTMFQGEHRLDFKVFWIAFQQMPYSSTVDPALVEKATGWRNLNYLRVLVFMAVNLALIPPTVWVKRMLCSAEHAKA